MVKELDQPDELTRPALADVFEQHRRRLRRIVEIRMDPRLAGRVDPSDVLQDAFIDATQRVDKYVKDQPMPLFVWLRFLAIQRLMIISRRHLGTQARDPNREISIFEPVGHEASSAVLASQLLGGMSSPSHVAMRSERNQRLVQSIESMDPIDREVLLLRHFEELTNSETANALQISPTTANNRYVRALKRLKVIMDATGMGTT